MLLPSSLPGLHKVERWLQEFLDISCVCSKKHPSALSPTTFTVGLCCFHDFLYLLHSYLFVHFHLTFYLTLQITILATVTAKPKMCLQENLVDCADCGGLSLPFFSLTFSSLSAVSCPVTASFSYYVILRYFWSFLLLHAYLLWDTLMVRQPLMEDDLRWKKLLKEDNIWWKVIFYVRWPSKEDDFKW